MKKALLLTILLFTTICYNGFATSIPDSIGVKKADGKNYLIHRIENAEGWYSIARRYGISYAELRMANKDSSDKLIPGRALLIPNQKLKIDDPHFDKNYIQSGEEVFYVVKEGETLFSIAKRFNTDVDSLKIWNNLPKGAVKYGQKLKVGYKEKTETGKTESVEVKNTKPVEVATPVVTPVKKNVEKTEVVNEKTKVLTKPDTSKPVNKVEVAPVKTVKVVTPPDKDTTRIIKTASTLKAETKKSPAQLSAKGRKEVSETGVASWIRDDDINPNKYYGLHRTAPIGTIVKVTNKMNGKYVFVKVVGVLPDTGDNTDLIIKISKASAEKLGVRDTRFQSELSFGVTEKP